MTLVTGMNHVAVVTEDLDRFVEFYTSVFDLDVVFRETTPAFRHAILRTGPDSWLHPAEVHGNPHGAAVPRMFDRGHLDHLAPRWRPPTPSRPSTPGSASGAPATARSTTWAPSTASGSTTPTACASSWS
jgi:catechol 2,3-dioxygenase-like lactoylglutathione lyase family enzyme